MGAVAAAMRDSGFIVTGQDDNVYPPMSTFLAGKGITITRGFRSNDIPAADLIVIGNAMMRGNPAVEAVLNRKLYYLSLPETLKQFFLRGRHNLVVTGTHGKTTDHLASGVDLSKRREELFEGLRKRKIVKLAVQHGFHGGISAHHGIADDNEIRRGISLGRKPLVTVMPLPDKNVDIGG